MYSNQSKGETHHVSKRVQQSKKEIEELKLELQKLINREESNSIGSNNLLDVNNVNEHVTLTPNLPMKYNSVYDVRTHSSRNKNDFLVKDVQECKVEEIKKKVRHYDIDETREYMRKQKEKRLLMKKSQTKESQNMVDLKKQKLKELQRKSLELVQKSIRQKREKPKSRENLTKLIPSKSIADMSVKDKLNKNISNCDNITIRCRDYDLDVIPTLQPIVTLPSLYNKEHHLAAVKIQAIFRCYRQRKLYKLILKAKKELEDKARNLAEESHKKNMKHVTMESEKKESVKRIESEKKDFMERIEFEKKDFVERIESEKKDSVDRIEFERVPSWLQPIIQPYPYNFITAVKQKLNIAVNTPPKTSDVAVQMSFSDICSQPQSPLEINRERIEEPIGKQSWKSFLSHGRLGLGLGEIKNTNDCDIKSILEKSKHSKSASPSRNVSDSDTSKDIPDLSSESIPKTKSNISDKISSNDLKINFERLKNLKLKNKNLENINNDPISKETQSKNFLQVPEVTLTVNSVVGHNRKLNGADNIIAHNRSNYSKSNSLRLNPSNKSDSGYNRRRDDSIIAFNISDYSRSKSTPNISEGLGEIKNTNYCDTKSILEKSKHSKSASPSRNVSDSDTSKDITDLSSESIPKTKSNISDKISSNDLKINFERLKNLKLKNKNLENINNDLISKETQSKHFLQVPEVNSTVNSVVGHNRKLNGADNIIAHNRSNYSKSNSLRLNPSNKSDSGYNRRRDDSIIAFNIGDYSRSKSTPNISESKHMSPKSYDSVQRSLEQNNLKTVDSELRSKSLLVSNKSDFKSLLTTVPKTSESNDSTVDSEVKSQNSERYTSNFTSFALSATSVVPSLKHPSVTLNGHNCAPVRRSLKPGDVTTFETQQNTNQIHLKFEAELHLLNDFNESLQQIMAIEKSLLDLQTKNVNNTIYCHQDTQTSVSLHDDTNKSKVPPAMQNVRITEETKSLVTVRSYSRDSEIDQDFCELSLNDTSDKSFVTTGLEMSQINESISTTVDNSTFNVLDSGSFGGNVYAGLSLGMFDQLIKDEDARIENLKTILKIREKALLDRTKGELMWLEIQKKHLIETGQLQEASIIKKKQRGILIKLQHEKQEMLRLKQMQKSSSKERKTILKEQRNTIKAQLSNNNSSTRIKRNKQKQRHTGPIKVYNLHQETVVETSASRKSSETDEVGTHCESIISHLSEDCTDVESMNRSVAFRQIISQRPETSKRTLLMREAALQKRRKAAEDLLQWHQRLLEEERKIVELEMAANSVINQVPNLTIEKTNNTSNEYTFSGSQLNSLWLNMTGSEEKRFKDEETYLLSQVALERFCNVARIYTNKSKQKFIVNFSDINDIINTCVSDADSNNSVLTVSKSTSSIKEFTKKCDSIIEKSNDYTSQFESPEIEPATEPNSIKSNEPHVHTNILENEIDKSKSTLHEIMQNISNISDEISAIYKLSSVVNCVKETKSDCESEIVSERSSSRESSRETTVQLEIKKSLSELIKTQSPCQDISSLRNSTRPNNRNNDPENALESIQTEIKDKITNDENVLNSVESNREIVGSDAENSSMIDVEEISLDDHSKPKYSNEIINNKETVRDFKDIMENIEFITSKEFTGESFSELNSVDVNVENTDKIIIDENQTCKSSDVEICENFVQISYVENEREENEKKSNITDLRVISNGALEEDLNKISECLDGSRTQNSHTISEIITENSNFLEGSQHNVEMKISGKLDGIGNISEDNEELDSKNTSEHLKTTSKEIINGIEDSEELTNDSITEHLENTNKEIINGIEDISAYEELDNNSITEHLENTSKEIINGIDDISADNEELDNNSITEHLKNTSKEIIDKTNSIDVKKRVSEILADVSILREDKSPRLQDIYTTTYDVTSSDQPSETGSPDNDVISVTQLFGEEVELFKKQLAIEQEIKQLELQQKEQIPYLYMREIPNKPPPPYTPPVAQVVNSILPSNTEQIDTIISNIAGTLYDGYKSGTLLSLSIQSNVNNIDKDCFTFVFDLCKELAVEYQKRFIEDVKPSWMKLNKSVAKSKPLSKYELKSILSRKSKEILGFERSNTKKANEAKWSRKKRDHVDDLLVLESQAEESEWTNYDDEEAIVRNEVTNDIMNMLLVETADVTSKIFNKRNVY